jgi:D-amino-acid dehydrogenase
MISWPLMSQVVVLGAGVVGLCCAYYARQQGLEVTVLERHGPDYEGSSFGNAGMIVPSHFVPLAAPGVITQGFRWLLDAESPFYVKARPDLELLNWAYQFWRHSTAAHVEKASPLLLELHLASRKLYEDLAKTLKPFGFEHKGLLLLCHSDDGLAKEAKAAKQANHLGMKTELLDRAGVAKLEPKLEMNVVGGVYYPEDAHLNPKSFMLSLREWLEQNGVQILWNQALTGWHREGKKIKAVRTARGDLEAEQLVLSAGIWSKDLLKELHLNLPMQAGKGYSMVLEDPPQPFTIPAILSEAKVAITPLGEAVRFGGTMEIVGLEERINLSRVQGIIKAALNYFPAYKASDFKDKPIWYGFRPCSPDGLPYLGKSSVFDNLFVATGHAMLGLSLGPITGKLISELLQDKMPSLALQALRPERFSRERAVAHLPSYKT